MPFRALALALPVAILAGACSVVGGKAAPEPAFTVTQSDGAFEVREYPELVIVATPRGDGDFGRLFNYISGANGGSREIPMTAPVLQSGRGKKIAMTAAMLQTGQGEEIAMTAPVLQGGAASEMIFVLPEGFTAETAPLPTDPDVRLGTIPARKVAVIRFSGRLSDVGVAENRAALLAWMAANGLTPSGPAESAGYNPPWTVPAMRRNEVLIPLEG